MNHRTSGNNINPDENYRPFEAFIGGTRATRRSGARHSGEAVNTLMIDELTGTRPWAMLTTTVLTLFMIGVDVLVVVGSPCAAGARGIASGFFICRLYGLMALVFFFLAWFLVLLGRP